MYIFFYFLFIDDVLIRDLIEIKGKLQELVNEGQVGKIIVQEKVDFENKIDVIFLKFVVEINNLGNLGWVDKVEVVIIEFEVVLGEI